MRRFEYLITQVGKKGTTRKEYEAVHIHDNNKVLGYNGVAKAAQNCLTWAIYRPAGSRGKIAKMRIIVEVLEELPREK